MSPEGALHFVPRLNRLREKGLFALATAHNLRTAYLKNALDLTSTDADEHLHWQPLHKVRWLQHVQTGVVVVVVGGPQHFVDSIDSIRESAGFRNDEMKLLNFDRVAWLLRPPDVRPHLPTRALRAQPASERVEASKSEVTTHCRTDHECSREAGLAASHKTHPKAMRNGRVHTWNRTPVPFCMLHTLLMNCSLYCIQLMRLTKLYRIFTCAYVRIVFSCAHCVFTCAL